LEQFEKLLRLLLSAENAPRHALTAFDLTQYVCERLQPDICIARAWLERLVAALAAVPLPADRRENVAAAILVLLACGDDPKGARTARSRLLRLGYPLSGEPPSAEGVHGFQSVLIQTTSFAEIWPRVLTVRTFPELARAYALALQTGQSSNGFGELAEAAPKEWPVLKGALSSPDLRNRILVLEKWSKACPRCNRTLPLFEVSNLKTIGVATAKNCCGRILVYAGG
jgi:hypothetical protein